MEGITIPAIAGICLARGYIKFPKPIKTKARATTMAKYKIDISSYDNFRAATLGKLYDVDNAYGYQCYDAACLLWTQLNPPRMLKCGTTGAARGAWEVEAARKENAGDEFDIITDVTKIKRGDIVVFGQGLGYYGHIGFADEDYSGGMLAVYSQNQGGTSGVGPAAAFSVMRWRSAALIGAFRYKKWAGKPAMPVTKTLTDVAYGVIAGVYGNGQTRIDNLSTAGFDPQAVQAEVNRILSGKETPPPAPAKPSETVFKVGDRVKITAPYANSAYTDIAANKVLIGSARFITAIHEGRNFPYQLGTKAGDTGSLNTTGFANKYGIECLHELIN
jgi:hypothetical protein